MQRNITSKYSKITFNEQKQDIQCEQRKYNKEIRNVKQRTISKSKGNERWRL